MKKIRRFFLGLVDCVLELPLALLADNPVLFFIVGIWLVALLQLWINGTLPRFFEGCL